MSQRCKRWNRCGPPKGERHKFAPSMRDSDERLQHALELAYRYLNRRDRTEAEVRRRLRRDDFDAALVDQAISTLIDQGYLGDRRFARLYVQDKRQLEEWGSERIGRQLAARGIDPELIEETLSADGPEETEGRSNGAGSAADRHHDERRRALALLRRRFPVPPQDRRQRERALGILLRKGYDSELALDALASYTRDPAQAEPW
jgi:regulatory protein